MTALPYPNELKPLTSLRFVAAFWVLLYHFKDHLGFELGQFGLIADGYLGVDLFFTLSGFILAHVYLTEFEGGRFGYARFLQNRLARVYPMHLAALAAMIGLFVVANAAGAGVGNADAFRWTDIPQHILMIHAWGSTPTVGWNFPSWSISAEWGAYLLFPAFAAFVLSQKKWPGLLLIWSLALCALSFAFLDRLHQWAPQVGNDFSQMTAQIGVLRILPSFLLGASLYAFGRARPMPAAMAWPVTLASVFWIIVVTTFHLWEGFAWVGLAGLILGLAETARHKLDAPVAGKRFVFLGAASYALYMIHLPIDIVWFHALERFGIDETASLALRIGAMVGVFVVCIGASMLAYILIEEPARKLIRKIKLPSFAKKQAAA